MTVRSRDALLVVDVQRDFLPGGALAVPRGGEVIAPLNVWLDLFARRGLPVFATRDWHPPRHCSFRAQGGPWPEHCVAGSPGAAFAEALRLPPGTAVVSKAVTEEHDAYSGFDGTDLEERLRRADVRRVLIGGLAAEYCVSATARDALARGFEASVLAEAVRALSEAAGRRALEELAERGAVVLGREVAAS
ncbi:MAG: isochorismatase family protein [Elusimicrobia bacterium]|nr:isochorismatase family protein [Elusimicrobiota bacterium]